MISMVRDARCGTVPVPGSGGNDTMAEYAKYLPDVTKYDPTPDEAAVEGIVKHLGIALRNRDSSLVAASDPKERAAVRNGFMKKKLALTAEDADLDATLGEVLDRMVGDRAKSRVTVCYLLSQKYDKLAEFH